MREPIIWALGVVLHEMAAGRLPFSGRSSVEVTSAILRDPAPPLPERCARQLAGGHRTLYGEGARTAIPKRARKCEPRSKRSAPTRV